MATQRIAAFDKVGDGTGFAVSTVPLAEPGPDELRFKVAAFGLNQADLLLTMGRHFIKTELPVRLGYEACGTVEAVGANVTRFKVGDKVTCIPNADSDGVGGEYAVVKEEFATAWPEGWSAAEAASLWMQYLTPYFPFAELFPFERGSWVMITAASGGTGIGSIGIAKLLGARVIATTRTDAKADMLKACGADVVLNTERDSFVADVMAATGGEGVRLINDTLCGPYAARLTETLADRGIMFIHGALGASDNMLTLPVLNLVYRRAGVYGYSLINELRRPGALARARDFVLAAIAKGELPKPTIDQIFPFVQVADAYARMQSGKQSGKIIVSLEA